MAQILKDLPAMQETQVQPLGWEDPLEKRMAWRRLWTEKSWGYSSRCKESDTTEQLTHTHTHTHTRKKDTV